MKKKIMIVLVAAVLTLMSAMSICAAEFAGTMSLMEATEDVKVYDSPKGNEVAELPAGTAALVVEETEDGWVRIMYQDIAGYVQSEQLKVFGDTEALDDEFGNNDVAYKLVFEEYEVEQKQQKNEMLWGAILIAIIVLIFVTSILSAIKKNREEMKYKPIYKGHKKAED